MKAITFFKNSVVNILTFKLIEYNVFMKFKNFKLINAITVSSFMLCYPLLKALTSDGNKLVIFLDALTIISLTMMIAGVFYFLYLKGDFDMSNYFIRRPVSKDNLTYEEYHQKRENKRKDSFNYPLFLGIFYLVVSYLAAALFC